MIFHAANGLIGADMNVRCAGAERPRLLRRHVSEALILGRGGHIHCAILFRFLDGFFRPLSGVDVVRHGFPVEQIHGDNGVLGDCPALQEKHLIVGRDIEQGAKIGLGFFVDTDKFLAAVAHLHHRHATALPVEHFCRSRLQYFFGQHRGSGAEIEYTHGNFLIDYSSSSVSTTRLKLTSLVP